MQILLLTLMISTASTQGYSFVELLPSPRGSDWLQLGEQFASTQEINVKPFYNKSNELELLRLWEGGVVEKQRYGEIILRNRGLAPGIELTAHPRGKAIDYRFRLLGIDICDLQVSLHRLPDSSLYYRGLYPHKNLSLSSAFNLDQALSKQLVINHLEASEEEVAFTDIRRCWLVTAAGYLPVYDFFLTFAGKNYKARVGEDGLIYLVRNYFHVLGKFRVYRENKVRSGRKERIYVEVKGDGYLHNRHFSVKAHGDKKAHASNNVFAYEDDDPLSAQADSFVHANLMWQWFLKMKYHPDNTDKIKVEINVNRSKNYEYDINNAFYMPRVSNNKEAKILLGEGDGINMRNIANDGDVVAHELGHHFIFKHLKRTEGESLILHEGLADYFVFAKTNNPCLAESVCPRGSSYCQLGGRCLRHADNSLNYEQINSIAGWHNKGQIVSGMLWDLRNSDAFSKTNFDLLVFNALKYLLWDSNLSGFIESMLVSDYELNAGTNCHLIKEIALARGISWDLEDMECNKLSLISARREDMNSEMYSEYGKANYYNDTSKSGYIPFGCASIAASTPSSFCLIYGLLLLPVIHIFRRQLKPKKHL